MVNGTYRYDLVMSTPLGKRHGSLELMVWNHFLNGYLTMFTRTIPIRDGRVDDREIFFSGDMKTLMNEISYQAKGLLSENGVTLTVSTERGQYPVYGELVETRRN